MGYYSKVGLVLTKEANIKLQKELEEIKGEEHELFNGWRDKFLTDEETGAVLYYWEAIKWYYEECDWVNKFLDRTDSREYLFVRLGEDFDDLEEKGLFSDNPFDLRATAKLEFTGENEA